MIKLLIVDDEEDIREFARNFFRKRKIEVLTAGNGSEALEIIAQEKPILVLLDVRMEGLTGIDVLRKLRESGNQIKIIVISGIKEEALVQEAERLGVTGYINKPLVLEELEKIVLKELLS